MRSPRSGRRSLQIRDAERGAPFPCSRNLSRAGWRTRSVRSLIKTCLSRSQKIRVARNSWTRRSASEGVVIFSVSEAGLQNAQHQREAWRSRPWSPRTGRAAGRSALGTQDSTPSGRGVQMADASDWKRGQPRAVARLEQGWRAASRITETSRFETLPDLGVLTEVDRSTGVIVVTGRQP